MRRMSGFSLMEMMVVLLITAIVAAASAPMINKKLMHDQAESGSPWLYVGQDNSIVYNVKGAEQTVSIGGIPSGNNNPSLFIKQNNSDEAHIMLENNKDDTMYIGYGENNIYITDKLENKENSVVIGHGAKMEAGATVIGTNASAGERAVTLGANASAEAGGVAIGGPSIGNEPKNVVAGSGAIAIGPGANSSKGIAIGSGANSSKGIAVGSSAQASAEKWGSVAIGTSAKATKDDSIAIGYAAVAKHSNSVVIGTMVETTHQNQIHLGSSLDTVYIPGNLVVDGTVILAAKGDKGVYLTLDDDGTSKPKALSAGENGNAREYNGNSFEGITISDRRLKNVGKASTAGLEDVKKLEVFNYTYKKDPTKTPHVGVMAQDLEKIFPKAVFKGDDGFLRIRMEDMFYAVVNAIKELDSKFEALRNNEIKTLQKQVADLEKQNKELLKRIEKIEKNLK